MVVAYGVELWWLHALWWLPMVLNNGVELFCCLNYGVCTVVVAYGVE